MPISKYSEPLNFPSDREMTQYLNNHPLLAGTNFFKQREAVEKTVQLFANTTKSAEEVHKEIMLMLKSIGWGSDSLTNGVAQNILLAVQDCAKGKILDKDENRILRLIAKL